MLRSAREHPQVVYEEFDPPSEWVHEEKGDIVFMDVSGFKKDELKVFLESDGKISVSGERPIEDKKWIRFRKELSQPDNCKANEIKAKFDCGILYIIIPRQKQQEDEPPKTTTTTTTTTTTKSQETEAEPSQNDGKKMESQANSNSCPRGKEEGSGCSSRSNGVVRRHAIARGGLSSNLKHLMLILVVVILVLGLGRRIKEEVFKLKSS